MVTPTVADGRGRPEETVGVVIEANIIPLAQIMEINSGAHGTSRKQRREW